MSEALPKPPEAEPATNDSEPFTSWRSSPVSEDGAGEPSSSIRNIGRFEAERSTHFQSSSSVEASRNGGS